MSKNNYTIEPLGIQHAKLLARWFNTFVDQDLGVVENYHVTVKSEQKYIENYLINSKKSASSSFVILDDHVIIGKADISPLLRYIDKHVAEIGYGILKDNSRAGLQLLKYVEETMKKRKFEIALYCILARNKYFRSLFKKAGFKEVGKIVKFYKTKKGYDNRIILEKIIATRSQSK